MSSLIALVRRELGIYFISPLAYIVMTGMMFIFGLLFYQNITECSVQAAAFRFDGLLKYLSFLIVIMSPLITMRLIAEEKNRGTIENLMTAPVTELQVVLGKYIASILFLAYLLLPTVAHAILAGKYCTIDVPALMTGYFGLYLMCSAIFAIGLFVSSVCESQVTAGVVTFVIAFLLIISSVLANEIPEMVWKIPAREIVRSLDPFQHVDDFMKGVVDSRPVVYFLTVIVFFNFCSVRALESRRWR